MSVGQALLLLVDLWRVPLQVCALHAERVGHLLRSHPHRHEHRTVYEANPRQKSWLDLFFSYSKMNNQVLRHRPPDPGPVPLHPEPSEESNNRDLDLQFLPRLSHSVDPGRRVTLRLIITNQTEWSSDDHLIPSDPFASRWAISGLLVRPRLGKSSQLAHLRIVYARPHSSSAADHHGPRLRCDRQGNLASGVSALGHDKQVGHNPLNYNVHLYSDYSIHLSLTIARQQRPFRKCPVQLPLMTSSTVQLSCRT